MMNWCCSGKFPFKSHKFGFSCRLIFALRWFVHSLTRFRFVVRSNVCCFAVVVLFFICVGRIQCTIPFRANLCNVFVGRLGGMAFNTHSWAPLHILVSPNSNKNNHFAYFFARCKWCFVRFYMRLLAFFLDRPQMRLVFSFLFRYWMCVCCVNMWVFFSSELNGSLPQVIKTVFLFLC